MYKPEQLIELHENLDHAQLAFIRDLFEVPCHVTVTFEDYPRPGECKPVELFTTNMEHFPAVFGALYRLLGWQCSYLDGLERGDWAFTFSMYIQMSPGASIYAQLHHIMTTLTEMDLPVYPRQGAYADLFGDALYINPESPPNFQ